MGDRANIKFIDDKARKEEDRGGTLWFYVHWDGHHLPGLLKEALFRGKGRWSDPSYLARIIFCQLVFERKGDENATTGYGISTMETDNERPHIIVYAEDKVVEIDGNVWTFDEYVKDGPANFEELNKEET